MKKIQSFLMSIMVSTALLVGGGAAMTPQVLAATSTTAKTNSINVSGSGEVTAVPDVAYVNVGVDTENLDAKKAAKENSDKMSKIVEAIKALKISDKEIKTQSYNISPDNIWNDKLQKYEFKGYKVSNVVQVTVNDIKNVGNVIDAAVSNGSNNISDVQFSVKDSDALYEKALALAVQKTNQKAKVMLGVFGITKYTPTNIQENSQNTYEPIYYNVNRLDLASNKAAAPTPVSAGTLKVKASVSITYEY